MNSKMTINNYQQLNLKINKNTLSKQLEQKQNLRSRGGLSVGRRRESGGKGTGNKKHKW